MDSFMYLAQVISARYVNEVCRITMDQKGSHSPPAGPHKDPNKVARTNTKCKELDVELPNQNYFDYLI